MNLKNEVECETLMVKDKMKGKRTVKISRGCLQVHHFGEIKIMEGTFSCNYNQIVSEYTHLYIDGTHTHT